MNFKPPVHRDICQILDAILLAIGQTFHQTDISFLLMYGLYTAICQSSGKVKDCRVTQKGRGGWRGLGVGRTTDKKIPARVTWASANRAAASRSAATRKANKGNVATPRCMRMMQTGGSAQGTPGTVHGNCWTLRAAAFILAPPSALWWCWLSTGQKSRSSQQNYRPWCQLYTNILYSCYNCIMLYVVMLLSNNRAKVDCITSMVLQPGGNDAVKRVPLS